MKVEDICKIPPAVISQKDREFYFSQGYLVFPNLLGDKWLNPMRAALADIVETSRTYTESTRMFDLEPSHSKDNPRLRRVSYLDDIAPIFWDVCIDSIIPDIAVDLLGPNVEFREILVNFKWAGGGAQVKWHQDITFYPHTHSGTIQFLVMLVGAQPNQGPLQVVPGSHKGEIFSHYDSNGKWVGAIDQKDLEDGVLSKAESITGAAGLVSVHHSRTIHGSDANQSSSSRPALVITYNSADAIPYTAPAYPSSRYRHLVRGVAPGYAHHEEMIVPQPPDWSGGYTSIYEHQEK